MLREEDSTTSYVSLSLVSPPQYMAALIASQYSERQFRRERSRSRSPSRRRSRSPVSRRSQSPYSRRYNKSSRSPSPGSYRDRDERMPARGESGEYQRRAINREVAASEAAKRSQKDNRVYVGNLSFQVRWGDLKDFMRDAGNVIFAEVMTLPNGMSKGCGVVEYSTAEEAQRAIRELNDKSLMGRPLFIREDREDEARFGSASIGAKPGYENSARSGGRSGAFGAFAGGNQRSAMPSKQLYVGGLNWEVGWQDLKDLFRQAGDIARADIHYGPDGNPKGSGTVVFTSPSDAQNAISIFDGAELNGMKLEVREERFSAPSSGPFGGGGRGGRGGYAGPRFGDRPPRPAFNAQPSNQIFVKNLPWSTANDDLIELFQTTGDVEFAEVPWEGGRSKGVGIVQFRTQEDAETAIAKFQSYEYGGRPLNIEYNARYRDFNAHPPVNGNEIAMA